jgi:alpha-glucosidase
MNLKGKRLENFATDQYAFQKDQEPLCSPLLITKQNKQAYGIFSTIHLEPLDFVMKEEITSFW